MVDNKANNNTENDVLETGRLSSRFLNRMANELKEQLNTLTFQQKNLINLLKVKEEERLEQERTKAHNIDLFSPIYIKEDTGADIYAEVNELNDRIERLYEEKDLLIDKITKLYDAAKCIDQLMEENGKQCGKTDDNLICDLGINILDVQEKERQRIARDLHDSTVQNLTSMVHKTELCIKLIDMDLVRAKLELASMTSTIKSTINDMRNTIYNLKPMSLDDLGLVATVERYIKQIMSTNDIKVILHYNYEKNDILPVINLSLFRVIQEACQNVIKHAMASRIEINIIFSEQDISITIKDDGKGFNPMMIKEKAFEQSSSFGLSIMKERVSLLTGTLNIQSEKEKGTTVFISVPLSKCEGEKNE